MTPSPGGVREVLECGKQVVIQPTKEAANARIVEKAGNFRSACGKLGHPGDNYVAATPAERRFEWHE